MDFMKDPVLDSMLAEIVDIFHLDGVELVRLNGLARHLQNTTGNVIDMQTLANVIQKLYMAHVIDYQYVMGCPHCGEVIYQIIERDVTLPKLCDTCKTMFALNDDTLLIEQRPPKLG
jgi:hypothetical protein